MSMSKADTDQADLRYDDWLEVVITDVERAIAPGCCHEKGKGGVRGQEEERTIGMSILCRSREP